MVGLDVAPQADDKIDVIACDITYDEDGRPVVAHAVELLGGLDVLVNNAGIGGPAPAELAPGDEVRTASSRSTCSAPGGSRPPASPRSWSPAVGS